MVGQIADGGFRVWVCIDSGPEEDGVLGLVDTDAAVGRNKWSWRKFRSVESAPWANQLHRDLISAFPADDDLQMFGVSKEFPHGGTAFEIDQQTRC